MNGIEKNSEQISKIFNVLILAHIPIFFAMAKFFKTEVSLAIFGPLLLFAGQYLVQKMSGFKVSSVLMGFTAMALSALMIHLGKAMIEWHFHIFVFIGILSMFANPWTIITAATTAAVHHLAFYFFLPESIFNYQANIWIVVIHALFVVVETVACSILALKYKKVIEIQSKLQEEISPLVTSIGEVSNVTSDSCNSLLSFSGSNSQNISQISETAKGIANLVANTIEQIKASLSAMEETKKSVNSSHEAVIKGKEFLETLEVIKQNMSRIKEESSQKLSAVESSVNNISDKSSIINDIVFQTKLLSFNASVEAARAGEHGKGFSVVAEEIGILATTSGNASGEINAIVEESKGQLNQSIEEISNNISSFQEDIEKAFGAWSEISETLEFSFDEIVKHSKEQENSLVEVSGAAEHQNTEVHSLHESLSKIDEATHESLTQLKEIERLNSQLKANTKSLTILQSELVQDKKVA